MKTVSATPKSGVIVNPVPYPNAVPGQLLHKVLDLLLVAAIGAGCAAILLFILALA